MQVYDVPQTAELIEAVRDTPVLVGPYAARCLVWSTSGRNLRSALAERRSSDRPNLGGRKSLANQDGTAVQVFKERQGPHRVALLSYARLPRPGASQTRREAIQR